MKNADVVVVPLAWLLVAAVAGSSAYVVGRQYGGGEAARDTDRRVEELQRAGRLLVDYPFDKGATVYD